MKIDWKYIGGIVLTALTAAFVTFLQTLLTQLASVDIPTPSAESTAMVGAGLRAFLALPYKS